MKKINDQWQRVMTDTGLLGMRVMLGVVFVYHGSQKLFGFFEGPGVEGFAGFLASLGMPLPTLNAYMAGGTEFFGGLLLIVGVLSRLVSIPLMVTMLVAAFMVGEGFEARAGGMEYPLTLGVVVAGLGLIGPGRFTLSHVVKSLQSPASQDASA